MGMLDSRIRYVPDPVAVNVLTWPVIVPPDAPAEADTEAGVEPPDALRA
ncbi:MAG: hypothetical protein ABL955_05155 [Elusimicrobiota bacterium]